MWGRKNTRIADLEAREEYRIGRVKELEKLLVAAQRGPWPSESQLVTDLRDDRDRARRWAVALENENAVLINRVLHVDRDYLEKYAVRLERRLERLARVLIRTRRDRDGQQRLADTLMEQILDLPEHTDKARQVLGLAARPVAEEALS